MTFNNEIEKTKQEIEILTAKLEQLKAMDEQKTPCEKAYKRLYGEYPMGEPFWIVFKKGYNSAQEDYKVGDYKPIPIETFCYHDDPEHLPYFVGN